MTLRELIQNRGHTQVWIAERLHIREDSFSRIVSGKTRLPYTAIKPLAVILDVTTDELLELLPSPSESPTPPASVS
jgi:plasmid maintenance system antidote protein VapI